MIQKFIDVVAQWKANQMTEDQIEALYGSETMERITEHCQEEAYGQHYA